MNKKRYAIVRVCTDNGIYRCPTNNGKCLYPKGVEVYCKKCAEINGDTKEQLVKKVEQIIRRNVKNGVCVYTENNYIHTTDNRFFWHWVAQHIVEFLGVE